MNPSAPSPSDLAGRTEGLGRRFGDRWAVRDLSLEEVYFDVMGTPARGGAA